MNDRELMKRIYDIDCADDKSAAEILSASGRGARVSAKARYAGIVAAAVICIVAVGGFFLMKDPDNNKLIPADDISEQHKYLNRSDIILNCVYDSQDDGKIVFYRPSDGETVTLDMTEEMLSSVQQFEYHHEQSMLRGKEHDVGALGVNVSDAEIIGRVCYTSTEGSKLCFTKLYSADTVKSGFIAMVEDKNGVRHYSELGRRNTDVVSMWIDGAFDKCYNGIEDRFNEGSKAENDPSGGMTYSEEYLNTHPYISYKGKIYFVCDNGVPLTYGEWSANTITESYLKYLSGMEMIGITGGYGSYLHGNCLGQSAFVFKSRSEDTLYAYTSGGIFKFGYFEEAPIPDGSLDIPEPQPNHVEGEKTLYFQYDGKIFTYRRDSKSEFRYEHQKELFETDEVSRLEGYVLLGKMLDTGDDPNDPNIITGNASPRGSFVFYNTETGTMAAISFDEDLTAVNLIFLSPDK